LDALARLADRYGRGELRFMASQDVLLPHVPDTMLGDLTQEPLLKELPYNPSEIRRGLVSCTGTDFCNLALIDTKTRAMALATQFEKDIGKTRPISVRWSGCPASCGNHHTADIGLQGRKVTVVGPSLTPALLTVAGEARLHWRPREYVAGDAAGFALVMVATSDASVSEAIAAECRARGVWINCADDPGRCDFILPAVFRRG